MGLSDIDEDEPSVARPPSSATPVVLVGAQPTTNATKTAPPLDNDSGKSSPAAASKTGVNLDDLFGGLGVGSNNSDVGSSNFSNTANVAPAAAAPKPSTAARDDVLDSLFTSPPPAAESKPSSSTAPAHAVIYVDSGNTENEADNLFDTSQPVQKQTYTTSESLLEAFEQQGKKGGRSRFDSKNSLDHLTKNKDDNKVKARLLALMNYYDVLGVAQTASEEEIKRSYKKKALELHPDRVGRDQTPEEAELFKTITKANEVLTDPEKRAEYDRQLTSSDSFGGPAPSSGNDWLSHLQRPL